MLSTMRTPTLNEMAARLDRLERSARRWRRAAIAIGLSAVAAAAPATQPAADEVRTHRLVIVDEQGRPAAVLRHKAGVGCGLVFVDPANPTAIVSAVGWASDGSGMLVVNTRDGRPVVTHVGTVTDKGVPLERLREAQDRLNRALVP